ncbi:GNAT family N-acetyltransferase [Rufibacter hautae]|uniref:N-acetyltransferase family protein n=1 Tax=Rufibacter hautae TaxID=2595005 RepID=A0A5B6TBU5_9BACT|nr:GNAT family N-acetyltransferase [Rufibacter hautae]KAA3436573.1 N-acetyltransferase family protein [Rufibacter hautae]
MDTLTKTILQPLQSEHYPQVKAIYEQGIATGNATFETTAPTWETWNMSHLPHSRFVALTDAGEVGGWAALSPVSGRCVYGGVAEVSVYVHENFRGQGLGARLLNQLITESEANGIWTLQAGIFKENEASVALHQKCGFRMVGMRERIGKLHGKWRDTILLERRSNLVGL